MFSRTSTFLQGKRARGSERIADVGKTTVEFVREIASGYVLEGRCSKIAEFQFGPSEVST